MLKKVLISIIVYFLFCLLQTSFFPHFGSIGNYLNLILITTIALNLLEKREEMFGLINAVIGGFLLDVFSNNIFGLNLAILLLISLFIKLFIKRYVEIPILEKI
ncbi:MAG TPA: rod shape-determining protein MreD [Candidatus Peregrinibacteria bacterium]|nr:rod shape-determining protein MreD [Candidatus Peregrinibacteria bacterium]